MDFNLLNCYDLLAFPVLCSYFEGISCVMPSTPAPDLGRHNQQMASDTTIVVYLVLCVIVNNNRCCVWDASRCPDTKSNMSEMFSTSTTRWAEAEQQEHRWFFSESESDYIQRYIHLSLTYFTSNKQTVQSDTCCERNSYNFKHLSTLSKIQVLLKP